MISKQILPDYTLTMYRDVRGLRRWRWRLRYCGGVLVSRNAFTKRGARRAALRQHRLAVRAREARRNMIEEALS